MGDVSLDGINNPTDYISGPNPEVDADILGILRQSAEYSIGDDDRISDFFGDVQEECAETLSRFIGVDVATAASSVEMLKVELNSDLGADSNMLFGRIQGDEEQIIFVFSLAQPDFKRLLHLVLSGKIDEDKLNAEKLLSAAENKLLLRVFNLLSEFLFEKFEALANRGVPRHPEKISRETFLALSELEVFAKVTMGFVIGKFNFSIDLAVPFELISTPPSVAVSPTELQEKNKNERVWKETLRHSIETLPVGLEVELISADMSLNEISRLVVGDKLNISFGHKPIRINYANGVKAFSTLAELHGSQFLLRVSSGA